MRTYENILIGDFETTVYDGQERTDVWASALVPLYSENVKILHSINDTWKHILSIKGNILIYYHNLKFDGSFWIDYFLKVLNYRQAYYTDKDEHIKPINDKYMKSKTFKYSISEMGQWYYIIILSLFLYSIKEISLLLSKIGLYSLARSFALSFNGNFSKPDV